MVFYARVKYGSLDIAEKSADNIVPKIRQNQFKIQVKRPVVVDRSTYPCTWLACLHRRGKRRRKKNKL